MFGWKTIASVLGAFVLIATAYTTATQFAWAFPAHRGYVQFTEAELRAYILKEVGELKPTLNMLVRNGLEDSKRREEILKSEIDTKVKKVQREIETASTPREKELLSEIIANERKNLSASEDNIRSLNARIQAIK